MAEIQRRLFELGPVDAEAAYEHRQQQHTAEAHARIRQAIGEEAYTIHKRKMDKEAAKLDAILQSARDKPMRPELQAALVAVSRKIRASVKPFANEYTMLGIAPGATKRDIKNAYRRQARKLHPDKGGDEAAMKALNAAYKQLLAATKE